MCNRQPTKQEYEQLMSLAEDFVLQNPTAQVLKKDREYPLVARAIEDHFNKLNERKKLILPELKTRGDAIAVFSDYGGEHKSSKYRTYSFLVCSFDNFLMATFFKRMKEIRKKYKLEEKEIAFKDFKFGPIKRSLDEYLTALSHFVPGLLFTLVVDKDIDTLYGENGKKDKVNASNKLQELGIGKWKPDVAEKLTTVVHIISYLVSLLSDKRQKIFWMTDHDSIAEEKSIQDTLNFFSEILYYYSDYEHPLISGGVPFKEKCIMTLDLLSSTDIVAGSLEYYFTSLRNKTEKNNESAYKVLEWLANDGIGLKKQTILVKKVGNDIVTSSINFSLSEENNDIFIPVMHR